MAKRLGRQFGVWAALLVVPGVLALEPVAALPEQQAPGRRIPEVTSPDLELPEPSVPEGEGALSVPEDWDAPGGPASSKVTLEDLEELVASGTELVERRDAVTEVFANANGTETVALHSEPVHFQPDGSAAWEKIDNRVVTDPARPGWVRNAANDWTVWFGPISPGAVGGVELETDSGGVRFVPELEAGSPRITPTMGTGEDADTVTYRDVWPGVDVRYTVSGGKVKEDIVVHDGGPASYPFVVEGLGLSAPVDSVETISGAPAPQAAVVAADESPAPGEDVVVAMPEVTGALAGVVEFDPVTVFDGDGKFSTSAGAAVSVEPYASSSGASLGAGGEPTAGVDAAVVGAGGGGQRLTVSVDEAWLEDQAAGDEPVIVDPTVSLPTPIPGLACSYWLHDDHEGPPEDEVVEESCDGIRVGTSEGFEGNDKHSWWRGVAQFNYQPFVDNDRDILGAYLFMNQFNYGDEGGSSFFPEWMDVYDATSFSFAGAGAEDIESRHIGGNMVAGARDGQFEGGCGQLGDWCADVLGTMESWQLDGVFNGKWDGKFGFTPDETENPPDPDWCSYDFLCEYSYKQFAPANTTLYLNVNAAPPAPTMTSPANGSLAIDTLTPTLHWTGAERDADNDAVKYIAKIGTGPEGDSGLVATSPEMTWSQAMSWQVPAGVLKDGVTYYWRVWATDSAGGHKAWTASNPWKLTVDRRMGLGGVSPTDSVGAVSTNLVTGNPSLTVSGPQMPAVGGGVGVNFVYTGRPALTGLTGTYREDTNNNDVIDSSDPVKLVRTDAQVSFNWAEGTPSPAVPADNWFARWAGTIRFPSTGTWVLGQRSDDGARVRVDGNLTLDDWAGGGVEPAPTWQATGSYGAGSSHRVSVDYLEVTHTAQVELWAKNLDTGEQFIVPADWLSPETPDMAPGWSLSAADANVSYIRATVTEGTVTLSGVDGATYAFAKQPNGSYKPPEGIEDVVLVNPDGTITAHGDEGLTYVFRNDGGLASVRSALDDRKPAAAKNTYDSEGRLSKITDPVSGRDVTFTYADDNNDPDCPNVLPPFNSTDFESKQGLLCRVNYWDGSKTELYHFKETGLLSHIATTGPGGAFADMVWNSFSYDSQARMVDHFDPVATDALWTGARNDTDSKRLATLIAYDPALSGNNSRVQTVTQPAGLQTDTGRAAHSYVLSPNAADGILLNGTATVTRAGVGGTYRSVNYDHRGRTIQDTNAAGQTTTTHWDYRDLVVATDTPDGLRTATWYNNRHQATDVWGPAPIGQFKEIVYGGTFYIPVDTQCQAHVAWSTDCDVPWTKTGYDEGFDGLEAKWFNNGAWDGPPAAHQYDPGDVHDWDITRPEGINANGASGRWTGDIVFPAEGAYQIGVCVGRSDAATVYIDGHKVSTHRSGPEGYSCGAAGAFPSWTAGQVSRLQIDYSDEGSAEDGQPNADMLHLNWITPGTTGGVVIPASSFRPGYSLATSTVDADGKRTESKYIDITKGIGPQHGLVTQSIVDPGPGGLNLTELTGYEAANGTGGFLRRLTRTLPAGSSTTTTNSYYVADNPTTPAVNEAELDANKVARPSSCGGDTTTKVNQGGMLKLDQAADPDGTGAQTALQREMIYDAAGRAIATRSNSDAWTCTTYDKRGRVTKVTYPAFGGQPARTVTNNYKADPDGTGPRTASPLVTSTSDATGTITVETDLLGRVISYKDVFGNTTTFTYDLAGRETANTGPVGAITKTYDNADRPTELKRNNQVLANGFNYDTAGRLHAVTYPTGTGNAGNGTTGTFDYNTSTGRLEKVTWTGPGGALITSDQVGRSPGGDVINQITDGVDHHSGNDYTYDKAGRLTDAYIPGRHLTYGYGTNAASCAVPGLATGKNTNRTSQTIEGGATTNYCYNHADRLTSATDTTVGTIEYDGHGNTTKVFGETHTYDIADRHMTTVKGTTTVAYVRDATDRIVERKLNGTTTARYGSTGSGDAPEFTTNASNQVQEVTYALPGGAMLTTRTGNANVWSYPNTHGDIVATANQTGAKQGATVAYDPYGNLVTGPLPDNSAGNFDYAWLGQHQRPLEHETTLQSVIEMGARQYSPLLGRFLEADPVQGGSCNDYDYVCSDSVNQTDIDGYSIDDCDAASHITRNSKRYKKAMVSKAKAKLNWCKKAVPVVTKRLGRSPVRAFMRGACKKTQLGRYALSVASFNKATQTWSRIGTGVGKRVQPWVLAADGVCFLPW